ncbi:transcriptional regulator [Clostridium botulinum]
MWQYRTYRGGENVSKNTIKTLRIKKGLSIAELSRRSGVNRKTIYRIENNKVNPRDYTIAKIENILKEE